MKFPIRLRTGDVRHLVATAMIVAAMVVMLAVTRSFEPLAQEVVRFGSPRR